MPPFSRAKRHCRDKTRHTPLDIRGPSDDRRASVGCCSSVVERTLGKGEAESSILSSSTISLTICSVVSPDRENDTMRSFAKIAVILIAFGLGAPPAAADDHAKDDTGEAASERQKVLGLGGLFFRAEDPAGLAAWYEKHLGINPVPKSYEVEPWHQEAGPTVFSPFAATSVQMGNPGKQMVLNFRVSDLDAFAAQLRADGVEVEVDPEAYPNGRFAMLNDPENNPIQLWEPAVP